MAEQAFKNVKVLKGIPVSEFMDTMSFFAASVGLNCVYCHVEESMENWDRFAEDVPRKQTARAMILMVNALNKNNFGGKRALTCYSCHRGAEHPKVIPSLADQYGLPAEDPNDVEIVKDAPQGPSADQILDKYVEASGGAQRLAALTSFVAKGTIEGYDTYHVKVPLEIYAKATGQRTMIAHTQNGDSTTVFDGRAGWVAAVDKPIHLLPLLAGSELDGAKLDADLSFPQRLKQSLTQWRVGFPVATHRRSRGPHCAGHRSRRHSGEAVLRQQVGTAGPASPIYEHCRWARFPRRSITVIIAMSPASRCLSAGP